MDLSSMFETAKPVVIAFAFKVAGAIALYIVGRWLIGDREAVIIVDWSTLKADESWHLLRAALAVGGRTLTLYEEVHPRGKRSSRVAIITPAVWAWSPN